MSDLKLTHQHLLLRLSFLHGITDPRDGKIMLYELVRVLGMKAVTEAQAFFVEDVGNKGLTGSINLSTSHIAFHSFDEQSMLMVDVYSCMSFHQEDVLNVLRKYFSYIFIDSINVIDRLGNYATVPLTDSDTDA